jgi:hypothetical protein
VGSTPVLSGGGLSSSTVSLCSVCCFGVSSTRNTGFTSAYCSGTPVACSTGIFVAYCSGTSLLPLGCSSTRVLCEAVCTLGGGGTISSSSSDHSITAALRERVVWSPPSDIPPSLRGAAARLSLPVSPGISPITGDAACDQHLNLWILMRYRRNFLQGVLLVGHPPPAAIQLSARQKNTLPCPCISKSVPCSAIDS